MNSAIRAVKRTVKRWLYGHCPGFAGRFPYFGTIVHFPPDSLLFRWACAQDIFELSNLSVLWSAMESGGWFFDVGASIGLISVPILQRCSACHVVSFEPSPNTVPFLQRTIAGSPYQERWHLVAKAAGRGQEDVAFTLSTRKHSAYEGREFTGRAPRGRTVYVPQTTLDAEWESFGRPRVLAVKIDVEGGEMDVLLGAQNLIRTSHPVILVEWNRENLQAYNVSPASLMDIAAKTGYNVLSLPDLIAIDSPAVLKLHMTRTENFLLIPRTCEPVLLEN